MLQVKTPDEVLSIIHTEFSSPANLKEIIHLDDAVGRVLFEDITADEFVPGFNRSTVDGYAVRAKDTFGCSDSIPAILAMRGEVLMGNSADFTLEEGTCCYVPTGGAIPQGADCAIMIEYTEDYGDGSIGILKPGAPGENMIFRGDDVFPGKIFLKKGRVLSPQDIGALATAGKTSIPVSRQIRVGIISTGDELVAPSQTPGSGQVRDVNSPMLCALVKSYGAEARCYGIVKDQEEALAEIVRRACEECDAVLISGGSSVGVKDASCRIIESMGTLLLHGIAMKPGKPTIMGKTFSGKPLIGLPGHPVAAYFVSKLFVLPLLAKLEGRERRIYSVPAVLSESISANHGRAQYGCVHLTQGENGWVASPVRSKSGLITTLAGADGYYCISRDCEGISKGGTIPVTVCSGE